jgi:hypothetical protein
MKRNIGAVDRTIRIVVGLFILSLIFWGPKSLWGLLGLIPLVTALVGWCPPYQLLGMTTRRHSHQQ